MLGSMKKPVARWVNKNYFLEESKLFTHQQWAHSGVQKQWGLGRLLRDLNQQRSGYETNSESSEL